VNVKIPELFEHATIGCLGVNFVDSFLCFCSILMIVVKIRVMEHEKYKYLCLYNLINCLFLFDSLFVNVYSEALYLC